MVEAPRQAIDPLAPRSRSALRSLVALFVLSLGVRLAVWVPVTQSGTLPLFDEVSYARRALAYEHLIKSYLSGAVFWAAPAQEDLDRAYLEGIWPPLHPLLIGLVFSIVGHSLAIARLAVVLQSAATTCVVFTLTARLAGRRAGLAAAVIHAVYPSFVAYSHLLWSETTYILACLGGLYFAVRVVDEARSRPQIWFSVLGGVCLGLAGLARAAALPVLVVVPLWLAWRVRHSLRRVLLPAIVLGASALVLLPWEITLWQREQRFTLLSTSAGYNLYLGNNPWIAEDGLADKVRASLADYTREHGVSRDEAGRILAAAYIREDPGGFIRRCVDRARWLWGPDWYVVRHFLYAAYPPLPHGVMTAVVCVLAASFVFLMTCILVGLCSRRIRFRHRSLLLVCVGFSMVPNVLCIANSRMALPLLAILLPAAGAGLASLIERRAWPRGALFFGLTAIGAWVLNPTLPPAALGIENQASAYYGPFVRQLEHLLGQTRTAAHDRVYLRYTGERSQKALRVTLISDAYEFEGIAARSFVLGAAQLKNVPRIVIEAPHAMPDPPVLELENPLSGRSVRIHPVQREAWLRWQPTGLADIEYCWAGTRGSAKPPDWMFGDESATQPREAP